MTQGGEGSVNTETGYTGASTPNGAGGFVYLRNRWYDPQTGRFLTQDPIALAGGVNLYAYAGNNPITYTDPFGLCPPESPWTPACDKGLESAGWLDPTLWLAGALATGAEALTGGLEFVGTRLLGTGASRVAADVTAENVTSTATNSVLNLATKDAARAAVNDLGLPQAQATAARSAIARATTRSTIDLIKGAGGNLLVNIIRTGRNGIQVVQSVISPNGAKKVIQYGIDAIGRVIADPK